MLILAVGKPSKNIERLYVHSHEVLNTLSFSFLNESYSDAFTDKGYLESKVHGSYFFHKIPLLNCCNNEHMVKEKPIINPERPIQCREDLKVNSLFGISTELLLTDCHAYI